MAVMRDSDHPCRNALTRRTLLGALALGAAAGAVPAAVRAAPPARLDPKDPAAAALGYVENAAQLNAQNSPKFVPGSNCGNCMQLQGKAGDEYRPCSVFPGKLVSVNGWCSAWTAEM